MMQLLVLTATVTKYVYSIIKATRKRKIDWNII